jgi:hypothetical protein
VFEYTDLKRSMAFMLCHIFLHTYTCAYTCAAAAQEEDDSAAFISGHNFALPGHEMPVIVEDTAGFSEAGNAAARAAERRKGVQWHHVDVKSEVLVEADLSEISLAQVMGMSTPSGMVCLFFNYYLLSVCVCLYCLPVCA